MPLSHAGEITIRKVRLDSGGYASSLGGKYFGVGKPVYHVESEDGDLDCFIRAEDRKRAREIVLMRYAHAKIRR